MTTNDNGAPAGAADRMAAIEALIIRYPDIGEDDLAELKRWFRKEASALDVATLASKDSTRETYQVFRKEQIDPFSARDLIFGLLGFAFVVAVVAVIGLRAI